MNKIEICDYNVIVIDIETTGIKPSESEITEIGAVEYNIKTGKIGSTFNTFVKINSQVINPKIIKLNGITKEILEEKGIENIDAMNGLKEFIKDKPLLAHNALFEYGWFKNTIITNEIYDTWMLFIKTSPEIKKYNINYLLKHFKIKEEEEHRALEDSLDTIKIIEKIRQTKEIITHVKTLEKITDSTKSPNFLRMCNKAQCTGEILSTINKNGDWWTFCTNYSSGCKYKHWIDWKSV